MNNELRILDPKKYTGLTTLIPGHIYKDEGGERVLFIGYGNLFLLDVTEGPGSPMYKRCLNSRFFYINVADMDQKVKAGILSPDFTFCQKNERLFDILTHSKRPKVLIEDLGECFPSNYFEYFSSKADIEYPKRKIKVQNYITRMVFIHGKYMTKSGIIFELKKV